ncbi:unnamed protein product [Cylindrotheca closterium]|uniref:Uncharacterized protein n=1 Tax=Cylindrotheca closterium TaxID=2856 RepID=A0AAD2CNG1_9STRA|nr:unnamed protein product [Cylindrotheca closterium]
MNNTTATIISTNNDEYVYMPSMTQQVIISSLQIPPSLLSLIGSSLIIINVRTIRKKTPYRRILLALSISDIISTVGWLLQPFLADKDAPDAWVWSIGNKPSCVMLGSFSQFGVTSHLYSLFLAVYFLFIVRFGVKERSFKRFERWIHATILGFCLSTAIAGVLLGIFRPSILSPGCWISAPPEGCSEDCPEAKWAWLFGGLPSILTLVGISVSNTMLYLHVRRTVKEGQMKAMANEKRLATFQVQGFSSIVDPTNNNNSSRDCATSSEQQLENGQPSAAPLASDDTDCSSIPPTPPSSFRTSKADERKSVLSSSDKQWKRVQEVGKQGFLYVGAYLLSFLWTLAINYLDSQDFEYKRGSESYLFPLLVLQALFAPALGFSNAIIFFRPKLQAARIKYPDEPFWWVVQQVVTGASDARTSRTTQSRPSSSASHKTKSSSTKKKNKKQASSSWSARINFAGERLSSSRLSTGSTGTNRWSSRIGIKSTSGSLDIISEDGKDEQASMSSLPPKEELPSKNESDDDLTELDASASHDRFEGNNGDSKSKQTNGPEDSM